MSIETKKKEYTFFWSTNSPFSNWHPCRIDMDNVQFNCAEQAMMYYKAMLFEDSNAADKIMKAKSPREQKAVGRSVRRFDQSVWEAHRERIVYDILFAKFSQNEDLKDKLMATKDTIIAEMSKSDSIWGTGIAEGDARECDESKWGLNLLGKTLMKVRSILLVKQ